ncbi:MAG: carboxypeptidase regulatory-like domain-containing protein [Blastocatellia bacterium]|nr:carboxypeptidase regulatory-like domain-containing protein [Blastocatellia bacterium]
MKKFLSFLLMASLSMLVFAQSNSKKPTGFIRGTVTTDTNNPAQRVKVTATRIGDISHTQYSAITTDEGTFRINLPVGSYKVTATSPGYIENISPSEKKYYRTGDSVDIRLSKGGVITGTVTNRSGEAVVGIVVFAKRIRTSDGELIKGQDDNTLRKATDDRGIYRIYGLQPGSYIVSVSDETAHIFIPSVYKKMVPTYYPSTSAAGAKEVSVKAGDETSNIDIRLRETLGYSIRGKIVVNESLSNKNSFYFIVTAKDTKTNTFLPSSVSINNDFVVFGVEDGEYEIQAFKYGQDDQQERSEPKIIKVRGADVKDVQLKIELPSKVTGRAVIELPVEAISEECKARKERLTYTEELVVQLRPDRPAQKNSQKDKKTLEVLPNTNGDFLFRHIDPGLYRLDTVLPSDNLYISSITRPTEKIRPDEISRSGIKLKAGETASEILIKVVTGAAAVNGKVVSANNHPLKQQAFRVYLVPVEAERVDNPLFYYNVETVEDYAFTFKNLAPGKYRTVVRESTPENRRSEAFDIETRKKLQQYADKEEIELKKCQTIERILKFPTTPVGKTGRKKK